MSTLGRVSGGIEKDTKVSLSDVMCKYKHIGTDVEARPYRSAFMTLFLACL